MQASSTTLDRVPIQSLIGDRYSKTKLYAIFKEMGITPIRDGPNSYITTADEKLLEQYDLAKSKGKATLDEFLYSLAGAVQERSEQSSAITTLEPQSFSHGIWMVLDILASKLQEAKPEPLLLHRQLEEIALNDWHLSTAQLRKILGQSPVEGDRYGFRFIKVALLLYP